jgi:hypothetical protein
MPGKNARAESGGFSAEERAAMKERAAELRAEGKKGAIFRRALRGLVRPPPPAAAVPAIISRVAKTAATDRPAGRDRTCDTRRT